MWFPLTLLGLVFRDLLPYLHCFLCFFPARGLLQRQLDQIIGEAGHGDLPGLGFVKQGTDNETGQGRGVVRGSGHNPFRLLVLYERTEFNSLYPQRNRLMKGGYDSASTSHPSAQTQDFPICVESMPARSSPLDFAACEASNRANMGH